VPSFPYTATDQLPTSLMPRLSLLLSLNQRQVEVIGLLDTGAAVNVLPYQVGLALGAVWEDQITPVSLVGSLGQFDARALVVRQHIRKSQPTKRCGWCSRGPVPILSR